MFCDWCNKQNYFEFERCLDKLRERNTNDDVFYIPGRQTSDLWRCEFPAYIFGSLLRLFTGLRRIGYKDIQKKIDEFQQTCPCPEDVQQEFFKLQERLKSLLGFFEEHLDTCPVTDEGPNR